MPGGSFNLRNWERQSQYVMCSGVTKLLGKLQDFDKDTLKYNLTFDKLSNDEKFTKRLILSLRQKIFHPVGMLCPANFDTENYIATNLKGMCQNSPLRDAIQNFLKNGSAK